MKGPALNHPYRDKVTGHMRHPVPLLLTRPSMKARRSRYARRDAMLRDCMELEEHYKVTPTEELSVRIKALRATIDATQSKINHSFDKGADFLPR